MSLVDVAVPGVADKTLKTVQALVNFAKAAEVALKDGWQPGQDLPAVVQAATAELLPVLAYLPEVLNEAKDKNALMKAVLVAIALNAKV